MPAREPARQPGRRPAPAPSRASGGARPDPRRRDDVAALLGPVVASTGLLLEDVELRSVGRRLVVRVLVDSDAGVSLDEVAATSQVVSEVLDASDVLGDEPYTLEVSSPGVDRPLTEPRHWRRSVGRLVALTLRDGRQVTGRLVDYDEDASRVGLETSVKGRVSRTEVALADVARAVVQVEFGRAADGAGSPGADADDTDDAGLDTPDDEDDDAADDEEHDEDEED